MARTVLITVRVRLSLVLRLVRAAPVLPPAVAWFLWRALFVAVTTGDTFSLRSAAAPGQLAILLRLARGRRRVVELGTATGWTAAAFALADPARTSQQAEVAVAPRLDVRIAREPHEPDRERARVRGPVTCVSEREIWTLRMDTCLISSREH
jgi:hypothetical protein